MDLGKNGDYILVVQAAKETGTPAHWLRSLVRAGKFPGEKLYGRYWAIKKADMPKIGKPVIGRPRTGNRRAKKVQA